jgi:hypothetical protein
LTIFQIVLLNNLSSQKDYDIIFWLLTENFLMTYLSSVSTLSLIVHQLWQNFTLYISKFTRMKNTVSDNEKINKLTEIRLFLSYIIILPSVSTLSLIVHQLWQNFTLYIFYQTWRSWRPNLKWPYTYFKCLSRVTVYNLYSYIYVTKV